MTIYSVSIYAEYNKSDAARQKRDTFLQSIKDITQTYREKLKTA